MHKTMLSLAVLLFSANLNAETLNLEEEYNILQTPGDTYIGNSLDQTYSLNPFLTKSGGTITVIDEGGNNIIELVGGLRITSSIVTYNEVFLTLNNGTIIDIRGANNFSFNIGACKLASITGKQQTFSRFLTDTLGLVRVPKKGESPIKSSHTQLIIPNYSKVIKESK